VDSNLRYGLLGISGGTNVLNKVTVEFANDGVNWAGYSSKIKIIF
jgi:hypothetical protein